MFCCIASVLRTYTYMPVLECAVKGYTRLAKKIIHVCTMPNIYTLSKKWHTYVHIYVRMHVHTWMHLIEHYHTCTCLRTTYIHMDIRKIRTIVLFIPSPQAHLYTYVQRKTACTRATACVHRLHISCIVILRLVLCTVKELDACTLT